MPKFGSGSLKHACYKGDHYLINPLNACNSAPAKALRHFCAIILKGVNRHKNATGSRFNCRFISIV
jgi:hypothetical protein